MTFKSFSGVVEEKGSGANYTDFEAEHVCSELVSYDLQQRFVLRSHIKLKQKLRPAVAGAGSRPRSQY